MFIIRSLSDLLTVSWSGKDRNKKAESALASIFLNLSH